MLSKVRMHSSIFLLAALFSLLAGASWAGVTPAKADTGPNGGNDDDVSIQVVAPITVGAGWASSVAIPPAFFFGAGAVPFFADDSFTFATAVPVAVRVTDDFCMGDVFRIYANAVAQGTTNAVVSEFPACTGEIGPDDAYVDPGFSSGCFPLAAGAYTITIEVIQLWDPTQGGRGYIRVDEGPCNTISLAPPTATNELGTPGQTHTVTATVADALFPDVLIEGVDVDFEITAGPNDGETDSGATDADGEVDFTYVAIQGLAGLGTDTIEACFTDTADNEVCDTATKAWVDTTPPVARCIETTNPAGKTTPPAGSTTLPGSQGGQNEDGFYQLLARDLVDPDPEIFVADGGSSFVAGPFSSGDKVKITQAPGATPGSKPMAGVIVAHITLKGDAIVYAVDAAGNVSARVVCLVPPPPK